LHHIYGIPYIPASQIKGTVRSYIIQESFNSEEEKAILDKDFCDVFGCSKEHEIQRGKTKFKDKKMSWYGLTDAKNPDREGKITFFDAFPINKINLSLDIMNVHYKEYYDSVKHKNDDGTYPKGKVKPPADWDSPSIINFLTVKETKFQFLLGARESEYLEPKIKCKAISTWLKEALEEHGIGAKTAVGYGYFS
jgi:CRISPR-associated protein Cmr6